MGYFGEFDKSIIENMISAFIYCKIITDEKGTPIDYKYIKVNKYYESYTGLSGKNVIGKRFKEVVPKSEDEKFNWVEFYGNVALTGKSAYTEQFSKTYDKWLQVKAYCPREGFFVAIYTDITDFKQKEQDLIEKNHKFSQLYEKIVDSEEELRQQVEEVNKMYTIVTESENKLKRSQELGQIGNWEIDLNTGLSWGSEVCDRLNGFNEKQQKLKHKDFLRYVHKEDRENLDKAFNILVKGNKKMDVEYRLIRADNNKVIYINSIAELELDSKGKPTRILGISRDITNVKEKELTIIHMAYHDFLTDLPNRSFFIDKLKNALSLSGSKNSKVAVIFLDLDNFKKINDTLGHSIGDKLLIKVAERISSCMRKDDILARLGGDEFSVLIENVKNKDEIIPLIEKINTVFEDPFNINNNLINLTVSMGISVYPDDGQTVGALLKNADMAMYKAKYLGKDTFMLFNIKMKEELTRKVKIESMIPIALKNNEFILYYQPQYETKTGKLRGFEALIRWNSPELGFLNPLEFISIAEESGLIVQIGEWVLKTAAIMGKKISEIYDTQVMMSVNISPIQLKQKNFVNLVIEAISNSGINPKLLELEVTEGVLIDSYDNSIEILNKLKEIGISIALDDFGTGYSSLSYLKKLPINVLKIDKCFIDEIESRDNENTFVETIVSLAHKLNIETLAEGVENEEQLKYLEKAQCYTIQGYYFSKPVPESMIEGIIKRNNDLLKA
ncbi:sensor domain-containing protein [Clostridium vincentii]|uniref:Phytochrome-like protein cph2 n=1 Tax=Clostridium vincentii TaxID=52704 RepID=A0A2T0BCA9_9CLOT|nr:GGDEF domain-containing phosphodiesterase [Clostridium vincentii]PRR81524.1 Phytochrome-like protein cph2 [Clostridium vincentii]